jgi:hypothetical protein
MHLWIATLCLALPVAAMAEPPVTIPLRAQFEGGDTIPYRRIESDDFHGTSAPAGNRGEAHVVASICAGLAFAPDARLVVERVESHDALPVYEARLQQLGFEARMDRDCSYWNAEDSGYSEAYVLQHEQLHFAFVEIRARRLSGQAAEIEEDIYGRAHNPEAAIEQVREELFSLLKSENSELDERHGDLDSHTSGWYFPQLLNGWTEKVSDELRETAP